MNEDEQKQTSMNYKSLCVKLTLLTGLFIFSCEEHDNEVFSEKEFQYELRENFDFRNDINLVAVVNTVGSVSLNPSGRTSSESNYVETSFGVLDINTIVRVKASEQQIAPNYSMEIVTGDTTGLYEYFILLSRQYGYKGYILQYQPSNGEFNTTQLNDYTGYIRVLNLSREVRSEIYFDNGAQIAQDSNQNPAGRTQETYTNCSCQLVLAEITVQGPVTGVEIGTGYYEWVLDCVCTGGGGSGGGGGGDTWGDGGGDTFPYYPPYGGGGSGGGSGSGNPGDDDGITPPTDGGGDVIVLPKKANVIRENKFRAELTTDEQNFLNENPDIASKIYAYLNSQVINPSTDLEYPQEAENFAHDLTTLANAENNLELADKLVSIAIVAETNVYLNGKSLDDNFFALIDPYVSLDLSNTELHDPLTIHLIVKYQVLKALNPDWSETKLFWETVKGVVHIGLDVFGLVPVIGEAADLINGVIYTIEGDGLNATLSYGSAIPIVGYGSVATKYGLKIINAASDVSSKVKLVWKVTSEGVTFGSRKQLRQVLGLVPGDPRQAHHIIPWEFSNNPLVQKAANSSSAFHMNELMNGIPLPTTNHLTGHQIYNSKIQEILNSLSASNPRMNSNQAYEHIQAITNQIKNHINNNPTFNLGQIANLISYP